VSVAITFDDLPAHGSPAPGGSHLQAHQDIVETLGRHSISGVFGFVNAGRVSDEAGRRALELWLAAGHPLANHTFTHANLNELSVAEYTADVERNDAYLAALVGDEPAARARRRTFRYPFLREGRDAATIDAVKSYLRQNDYRIAEVTIDSGDWAYTRTYGRCVGSDARDAIASLRQDFVERALHALDWSKATANALYGRPIAHVMVLHAGSFTAFALDELLSAYERAGVRWVGLDEALADPIYTEDVRVPAEVGTGLLERRLVRDRGEHPSQPAPLPPPFALLAQLCR